MMPASSGQLAFVFISVFLVTTSHPCRAAFSSRPDEKQFEIPDSGIVAAFADMNADKMTDILLIDKGLKSFTIMKHEDHDEFEARILSASKTCYMKEEIVSLVPGDFHGNTFVDVAVISRNPGRGDVYNIRIVKGSGPGNDFDCGILNETTVYRSIVEPLLLDYNGDMICDLLIQSETNRSILQGPYNNSQFTVRDFPTDDPVSISKMHSNHFVDFNQDSVADIIIETANHFEYWYAHVDGSYGEPADNGKRKASKKIDRPKEIGGLSIAEYGLSFFTDFDGDSFQEHLMPVNIRINGDLRAAVLMFRESDYKWSLIATNFTPSNETEYLMFHEEKYGSITFPRAARKGDVNADGYPDLVSVMRSSKSSASIIVLKNIAADSLGNRTFTFMSKTAVRNPLVAAFMDLTETGTLDIVYSSRPEASGNVTLGSMMNVVAHESYFLKIMVATSRCPENECVLDRGWSVKRDIVDYGSNLPGPYIWYSLQDVTGMRKSCGAGQMTSASHFALQTPYLIMGLGEYANYIDKITITLPYLSNGLGTGIKRTREEEQIVPDAQIIIVPRYEEPRRWIIKMWISITGNQIKHTGYTLYLIFCILLIIIMALHKKEVMEDADENKRFKQNWLDHRR